MSGADIVQNELGYTGKGIKVAVMDTGIDVDHPAFGGDGVARNDSPLFPAPESPTAMTSSATHSTRPRFGDLQPGPDSGSESGRLRRPWLARRGHRRRQ